jgi:hypothetical protein
VIFPELRLDLDDALLLLIGCSVTKDQIHIFKRLLIELKLAAANSHSCNDAREDKDGARATNLSACLWNAEVCESHCQKTECRKEDISAIGDCVEHIRGHQTNDTGRRGVSS